MKRGEVDVDTVEFPPASVEGLSRDMVLLSCLYLQMTGDGLCA